jgi:hypothetical protein
VTPSPGPTVDDVLDRASSAYGTLAEASEAVDDEWSYVQDLTEAWASRFDDVRLARGAEPVDVEVAAAIDAAIDEVGRIGDPHRAIDWLSTFPQVTLIALGERP